MVKYMKRLNVILDEIYVRIRFHMKCSATVVTIVMLLSQNPEFYFMALLSI